MKKRIFRPKSEFLGPKQNTNILVLIMFSPPPGKVVQRKKVPFSQIDIILLADFGLFLCGKNTDFRSIFCFLEKRKKTVRLISVVRVVNGIQVVQVVKVACFDDVHSESIWFTWSKPSDY